MKKHLISSSHHKKILMFGVPGAGKTSFAIELSELLGYKLYHLDHFFFVEGNSWKERPKHEFLLEQEKMFKYEKWILDGNCMDSLELRFKEADLILYFAPNSMLCFFIGC